MTWPAGEYVLQLQARNRRALQDFLAGLLYATDRPDWSWSALQAWLLGLIQPRGTSGPW